MSETDSFIEEVSEEVRRDRLFRLFRRYGWIALAVVILAVGGAAWNEYRKASERRAAQALGDALLAADGAAALDGITAEGPAAQAVIDLTRAEALATAGDKAGAAELLRRVGARAELPAVYRDLAALKALILEGPDMATDARLAAIEPLAQPGAPFRLLALEQRALAQIAGAMPDEAVATLRTLLELPDATPGLRQRATQMIVALGEDPAAS